MAITATFTVTMDRVSSSPVTVAYATANGTAIAGTDYTAKAGTLTFNPGETSKQVMVDILPNTPGEPAETFSVQLSNPTNATIADGVGSCTIPGA